MSGGGRRATKSGGSSAVEPRGAGGRRASLPYRNVVDLAKALCKTCRQRRASYAAGVVIALPGIIQSTSVADVHIVFTFDRCLRLEKRECRHGVFPQTYASI
ncbi:hypothetical protein HPB51_010654 [Rhipicephalus microplus]|uniref:Uncharacterized protein n=1 Tax=Rhipicephalus microplus TaxID=6941 RepID=A0A9J6ENF2_RHIMP|nr:hypothetical protein HPB51_010654 [Rhipicephalus microplus]